MRWPPALLRLGDASYAIYLAHGFVLGALAALHLPAAWMLLAAALALSTAAGLAVHHWVERPIAAWFARRRTGEAHRQEASMGPPSAGLPTARRGLSEPLASYAQTCKGSEDPLIPST